MSTPKQPADMLEEPDLVLDRRLALAVQEVAQRVDRRLASVAQQARGHVPLAQQLLPAAQPAGDFVLCSNTGTVEGCYCFPESKTGGAYGHAAGAKDFLVEVPNREEGLRMLKEDPGQWAGVWGSEKAGFVPMWKLVKRGSGFAPESGADFSWVQAKYSGIGPASFKDEIFDASLREHGHADIVQLPSGWQAKYDKKTSQYFYLNHEFKLMSWVAPVVPLESRMDLQEVSPASSPSGSNAPSIVMSPQLSSPADFMQLPSGWQAKFDKKTSKYFYVNHELKLTSWVAPVVPPEEGMNLQELSPRGGMSPQLSCKAAAKRNGDDGKVMPHKQWEGRRTDWIKVNESSTSGMAGGATTKSDPIFPLSSRPQAQRAAPGKQVDAFPVVSGDDQAEFVSGEIVKTGALRAAEADAQKQAEEEEGKRRAEEEERKRKEEEEERERKAEEDHRAAAAARKKAEEEAQREEERKRVAAEAEARKKAQEERKRKAEEERRAAEAARKKTEEEAQREEERKRVAAEAEARKKAEEERKRKAEEERRAAEVARKKAEENKQREEERKRELAKKADDSAAREREEKKSREEESREVEGMAVHKAPAGAEATTTSADPAVKERKHSNVDIYRQARRHKEKLAQKESNKEEDTGVFVYASILSVLVGFLLCTHASI